MSRHVNPSLVRADKSAPCRASNSSIDSECVRGKQPHATIIGVQAESSRAFTFAPRCKSSSAYFVLSQTTASCHASLPTESEAFGSAPARRRTSTQQERISADRSLASFIRGVAPRESRLFASTPASIRAWRTRQSPRSAAQCIGFCQYVTVPQSISSMTALGFAPEARSLFTCVASPADTALTIAASSGAAK